LRCCADVLAIQVPVKWRARHRMKYITGFVMFWYDFIVGDAWEVAVGVLVSLLLMYLAAHYAGDQAGTVAALLLPVMIVALLGFSLWKVSKVS
jgi:hypothetical protein